MQKLRRLGIYCAFLGSSGIAHVKNRVCKWGGDGEVDLDDEYDFTCHPRKIEDAKSQVHFRACHNGQKNALWRRVPYMENNPWDKMSHAIWNFVNVTSVLFFIFVFFVLNLWKWKRVENDPPSTHSFEFVLKRLGFVEVIFLVLDLLGKAKRYNILVSIFLKLLSNNNNNNNKFTI